MDDLTPREVEVLEEKYLNKFYHLLKFYEEEMMDGFRTMEAIKDDWIDYWGDENISDFATGAERIVYSLFNGKGIGLPNSAPVGSDMFFETKDAFIHIDMKTVQTDNIADFAESIFVGNNQNSYKGVIKKKRGGVDEEYQPCLPTYYHKKTAGGEVSKKVCLTYFLTILYEKETLDVLVISLLCMPNGSLSSIYGSDPLKAGKNLGKARFNFSKTPYFRTFPDQESHSRIKVAYFKPGMKQEYLDKLNFYRSRI